MQILHVYKSYYPDTLGGIELLIKQLMVSMKGYGCQSRLFTTTSAPGVQISERPEGTVIRSPSTLEIASTPFSWKAFSAFREQVAWADIVHYHFPWPFADLLHVGSCVHKPSVVTYHSDIIRQKGLLTIYKPLMRWFLGSVDAIVATSPNYVVTSPYLSQIKGRVRIIPGGIEEPAQSKDRLSTIERWRSEIGDTFFLFVGVLRYYKGLHDLLRAACGLPVPVVVVGQGPEADELRTLAASLPGCNVRFLGAVSDDDKLALLELCLAFVLPSHLRSEALGMSLVEAAMHGRAMISCEIGTGTSFVNVHGQTGLVVPPNQPVALHMAMLRLLADPEATLAMGRAARRRYEANFTAESMARQYFSLYGDLCRS